MRKVVHRINVPFASGTVVRMGGNDAVHNRIAEVHIRIRHVYLGTEHHLAFLYLAALHCFEETQVLLDRTVAVRRCHTGLGRRSFLLGDLLGCLFIDISLAGFDKTDSQIVELLEIIGGIEYLAPLESQPSYIAFDGLYVFGVLFGRVRIVETQVTYTIVFLRDTEVHTNSLHMTNMQVAVRLRRETGLNTSVIHSVCQIFLYDLLNKIETFLFFACRHDYFLFHIKLLRHLLSIL